MQKSPTIMTGATDKFNIFPKMGDTGFEPVASPV
jgi:hypothetical protein